jgi:hypothetical protein
MMDRWEDTVIRKISLFGCGFVIAFCIYYLYVTRYLPLHKFIHRSTATYYFEEIGPCVADFIYKEKRLPTDPSDIKFESDYPFKYMCWQRARSWEAQVEKEGIKKDDLHHIVLFRQSEVTALTLDCIVLHGLSADGQSRDILRDPNITEPAVLNAVGKDGQTR